jgi:hypothetical protein
MSLDIYQLQAILCRETALISRARDAGERERAGRPQPGAAQRAGGKAEECGPSALGQS